MAEFNRKRENIGRLCVNRARRNHLAHYEERLMLSRREIKWLKKFLKNEKRKIKRKIYKISR